MAYATPEQMRAYLVQVGEAQDALLATILERATDLVDGVLGFSFGGYPDAATARDVVAIGGSYLELPAHQPGSVEAVAKVWGKGTVSESATPITDYAALGDGRLYREAGWSADTWYRVTAIWGFGPPPAAVVEVTIEVAINLWRSRDRAGFTESLGAETGGAIRAPDGLTGGQRYVLERVRRQVLGVVIA